MGQGQVPRAKHPGLPGETKQEFYRIQENYYFYYWVLQYNRESNKNPFAHNRPIYCHGVLCGTQNSSFNAGKLHIQTQSKAGANVI